MGERHVVTIAKVVAGGLGLARIASGMVVLVPFVLPGETVAIRLGRQQKGFAEASLLSVLEPSPHRLEPLCPHFQECGGCHLQHGDYGEQLAIKESILSELLGRSWGGGDDWGPGREPILASPASFYYRQRIRLQVDDGGRLGFFARRSHSVVAIDSCPLAMAKLNQTLADLRRLPAFRDLVGRATALELLFSPADGQVVVIVWLKRKPRPADQQAARALAVGGELPRTVWLAGEGFAMSGPFGPDDESGDIALALPAEVGGRQLALRLEAGGFCQVNLGQNQQLIRQLLAWAEVGGETTVLDLFCGMGNFSLPLALTARQVVGTDLQRSSIRGAEANARANGLGNCLFRRADAVTAARDLIAERRCFDLVLLDPPRQGCRELIPLLPALGAERIILISCDPATMCRDLAALQGLGFQLQKVRGVDMFPQTCHLEAIALLARGEPHAVAGAR